MACSRFVAVDWTKAEEEPSDKVAWVDDWDDEKVDDDFSSQLR
jgi:DSS1/SEM1 family